MLKLIAVTALHIAVLAVAAASVRGVPVAMIGVGVFVICNQIVVIEDYHATQNRKGN